MWSEIKSDPDFGHYYPPEIYTESLMTTFENEWDVMPKGRHKAIHGVGVICPFELNISHGKVENILKGSLDSISSHSPSVKIQIMCVKVCLRCKGNTLLGVVNKLLRTRSLLTSPSNVLPYFLK